MFAMSRPRLQLALLLAAGLAASVASTESQAYTAEEQQACSPDAFRLCSAEIPDVDRITACMIRNRSQLSPQCRAFFRGGPEAGRADPPGRPVRARPAHKSKLHRTGMPRADAT